MKKILLTFALVLGMMPSTHATPVLVPDNGGTAEMPIQAAYPSLSPMIMDAGFPVGSQININALWLAPTTSAEQAGGSLGGNKSLGGGPLMQWTMQGTGAFSGYNRVLVMPGMLMPNTVASFGDPAFAVTGASYEVHSAPRTLAAPVQTYATDLFRMFSQIASVGDPDFDLIRLVAGTDFGLPSPGQTKLTQVGPNWNVESYYDVTYRIDFVGRPGGPFGGMSGSSTHQVRFQIGQPVPEPSSSLLLIGSLSTLALRRR
jgi:hypothetical protein